MYFSSCVFFSFFFKVFQFAHSSPIHDSFFFTVFSIDFQYFGAKTKSLLAGSGKNFTPADKRRSFPLDAGTRVLRPPGEGGDRLLDPPDGRRGDVVVEAGAGTLGTPCG